MQSTPLTKIDRGWEDTYKQIGATQLPPWQVWHTTECGKQRLALRVYLKRDQQNILSQSAKDSQKRISAGLVAKRSPLTALAKIYPALRARDQIPRPGREIPRFQAETILATPTTNQ